MARRTYWHPEPEQTKVGVKDDKAVYIPVETRIRLLLRVPPELAIPNSAAGDEWEPALREAVAASMLGIGIDGYVVDCVAVQEFEPGNP